MQYRQLIATAAAVAATTALGSLPARATDSPQAIAGAHTLTAASLRDLASSDFETFASPADRTVRSRAGAGPTITLTGGDNSAHSVWLRVSGTTTTATNQNITVAWGDGATTTQTIGATETVTLDHSYANTGSYTVTVTDTDGNGNTSTNAVQLSTAGSGYAPYGPARLLDTRNGTGAAMAALQPGQVSRVQIGGNGGIPAEVSAVVLNITVTNATGGGFITAYADGRTKPATSNVNFIAGQTVPNLAIVPVGADGYVDLAFNGWGSVDVIADVTGYLSHSTPSGYTSISSTRLVDTRNGTGAPMAQVSAYGSIPVQIAGAAGGQLPATGITGVALNVTVTAPGSDGHLTVYPSGQSAPTTSNLNFTAGQSIANAVTVPVGPDGKIQILNDAWKPADVVVDVVGYYSGDGKGAYMPVPPLRITDTRTWQRGPLPARVYDYELMTRDPLNWTASVLNVTVTDTADAGHMSVSPDPNSLSAYQTNTEVWPAVPKVSTLNWTKGTTVANFAQAATGANGIVDFWNESDGNVDLVLDYFGYYQNN